MRARDACFAQGKELGRAQPRDRIRTSLLGFHGKVVGSAVRYHCAEDEWAGGGRNLCQGPPISLVYIPQVGSICFADDRMRRHETTGL